MKKIIVYIISLLACLSIKSEEVVKLASPMSKGGTVEGCAGVVLLPGFTFKSTSTEALTLRQNLAQCADYPQKNTISLNEDQLYMLSIVPTTRMKSVDYVNGQVTLDRTLDFEAKALVEVTYFDNHGNSVQSSQLGVTPNGKDLVTNTVFDALDRPLTSILPVTSDKKGAFIASTKTDAINQYGDANPFSENKYWDNVTNQLSSEMGPGKDWHSAHKSVRYSYSTNLKGVKNHEVTDFTYAYIDAMHAGRFIISGKIPDESLHVKTITDEDENLAYEFTNLLGQLILRREMVGGDAHDTNYIYDLFGNIRFVLPPILSKMFYDDLAKWPYDRANNDIKMYGYMYNFDSNRRCIEKRLPGAEPIYYIYDKADQLIFSQDGEQRKKGEWAFSIPDAFGRVVLTGISKNALTLNKEIPGIVRATCTAANNLTMGYTVSGISLAAGFTVLTANYYDNYNFLGFNGIPNVSTARPNAKGMLTGALTAQLNSSATKLYSVMYYDNKGQLIQTKSNNHLGGTEDEYITYSFVGMPLTKKHVHIASGVTTTELYTYAYDHAGRLLDTKHQLNNGTTTLIASNTYDELGRLQSNKKGNQANLNTLYTYNIRSWTNSMKSNVLHINLDYTHSGNVKSQSWTQEGKTRKYDFTYDGLSRLTTANFTGMANEQYKTAYAYDKHGNMNTLSRYGKKGAGTAVADFGLVDNLAMSYNGNQLNNVHNTGIGSNLSTSAHFADYSKDAVKTKKEYAYNANGAMTQDLNKGITAIQYNSLNLPTTMDIKSPVGEARNEYTYSADGQKLKVVQKWNPNFSTAPIIGSGINVSSLTVSKTTDYVGNKIYEDNKLKRTLIDGGYIENGKYHYYLTDHLGNNRAVADAAGVVTQRTHYYPFGMAFAETTGQESQPYKYNGMELDTKHGLNMYDYSARYMDPGVGRFTSMDPLAEKYYSISPYAYVMNNPMRYTDPTGMVVRDSITNQIVFISEAEGVNWLGGFEGTTQIKGTGGYIIANNGEEFGVIQVTHYLSGDEWLPIKTQEEMNAYGTNCAGAISLDGKFLPLDASSYQSFLEAEGYTKTSAEGVTAQVGDIYSFANAEHVMKVVGMDGQRQISKSHWLGDKRGGVIGNIDVIKGYHAKWGAWANSPGRIDVFRPKQGLVDKKVNSANYKSK